MVSEREKIVIPQRLRDRFDENTKIWSYSNISSIDNCTWEYYLSRVKKQKGIQNIYSLAGTISHNLLEDYYEGKITYEEMLPRFESDFLEIELGDYRFHADDETNAKRKATYKANLVHFFKNHKPVTSKVVNEQVMWIDIHGHLFIGYVDAMHNENGQIVITDYKTSSINEYKGKKQEDKAKQLLMYATGLVQAGVPIEKIRGRWNFLKYTDVQITYKLKSGQVKTKNKICERVKWVEGIKSYLKKDLMSYFNYQDWEAEIMMAELIQKNSIDELPDEIKKNYVLSDAFVEIEVSEKTIEGLKQYVLGQIEKINSRNWKLEKEWRREPLKQEDTFYCTVLCGQRRNCQYYKDYLASQSELVAVDEELMAELDELM